MSDSDGFNRDSPSVKADHDAIAYTPDQNAYHRRGNGTVIPRSRGPYGNEVSRGFHHEQKGKIFIDPADPSTGLGAIAEVDLSSLTESQVQAARALAEDPTEVMRKLDEFQKTGQYADGTVAGLSPILPSTVRPGSYQVQQPAPQPAPPPAPQPAPQPAAVPPVVVKEAVSQSAETADAMQTLIREIRSMVQPPAQPPVQPTPSAPAEPPARPETVIREELYKELGMPFLNPQAAPVVATFMTEAGTFRVRYRAVVRRGDCVSLVMDNRYSEDLFVPCPAADNENPKSIRLVVERDSDGEKIDVNVVNPDLHVVLGCLDIYNMLIVQPVQDT